MDNTASAQSIAETAGLLAGYASPEPYDEMVSATGELREHWRYLIEAMEALGRTGLSARLTEAQRLIRDNGVTYNIYGDPRGVSRPWDLDLLPLPIPSQEWLRIERGLAQRAELLDQLLADLYGEQSVIRKGLLPPDLVFGHPGYLRACHGASPDGGRRLPFYAADLVRAPDGDIRVVGDRAQVPSGAGYALENRVVLSRVIPSVFRDSQVHRLAMFFRRMRSTVGALSPQIGDSPQIVVLTPGPKNEAYFEHAYLANYLGYTLVQGSDLVVRDGAVWLRSLDGLQPVDVILRRVDGEYCDPLELREDSFLGIPGLLQAVRGGRVAVANPLGSGFLDNPALTAFLPELCRHFMGEDLLLEAAPTWWCGERKGLEHVLAHPDRMVIKRVDGGDRSRCLAGAELSKAGWDAEKARILRHPEQYAGQEYVPPSTAPVMVGGRLEARKLVMRSFLVASQHGYEVMPGGLTRVAGRNDARLISNQFGGIGKDTWVLASEPGREESLLVQGPSLRRRTYPSGVPSRVADDLFWVGRYAERAQGMVRLLRVIAVQLTDPWLSDKAGAWAQRQLLRAMTLQARAFPGFVGEGGEARLSEPEPELLAFVSSPDYAGGVLQNLGALLQAAWSVRDHMSGDTWRVINEMEDQLARLRDRPPSRLDQTLDVLDPLVTALVAFAGLTVEDMTHGQGWCFLEIGRRVERCLNTLNLLRGALVPVGAPAEEARLCEWILSVTDSLITYRRRYQTGMRIDALLDLILYDEDNPRAIGFQLSRIEPRVRALPRETRDSRLSREERLILQALTDLRLADPEALLSIDESSRSRSELERLLAHVGGLTASLSDAITATYFRHEDQPHPLSAPGRMQD